MVVYMSYSEKIDGYCRDMGRYCELITEDGCSHAECIPLQEEKSKIKFCAYSFTGKRLDNGKIVTGDLLNALSGRKYIVTLTDDEGCWENNPRLCYIEVDPKTIEGFSDKVEAVLKYFYESKDSNRAILILQRYLEGKTFEQIMKEDNNA
jgi:hypothetical protein